MKPRVSALVFSVGLVLCGVLVFTARHVWYADLPAYQHAGVHVRYVEGSTHPWAGVDEAIEAILFVLSMERPGDAPQFGARLVIEVVGPDAKMMSGGRDINGTMRREGPIFGPEYLVLVVRQLRSGSRVLSACESAIHHEFAEHAYPLRLRGDLNLAHDDTTLIALGARMSTECSFQLALSESE